MDAGRKETATEMKTGITSTDVHLRGRALFVARTTWLMFSLLELFLFLITFLQPLFGSQT
jgi:hypothetical protein